MPSQQPRGRSLKRYKPGEHPLQLADWPFLKLPLGLHLNRRRLGITEQQYLLYVDLMVFWWWGQVRPSPSQMTLGALSGMSRWQVSRNMLALEGCGLVKRSSRGPNGGSWCYDMWPGFQKWKDWSSREAFVVDEEELLFS